MHAATPKRVHMSCVYVCVPANEIGDAGAASLAEAIKSCPQLKELILIGARVRVTGGSAKGLRVMWMMVVVDVMSMRWSMMRMMGMVARHEEEVRDDEGEEHEVEDDHMHGISS